MLIFSFAIRKYRVTSEALSTPDLHRYCHPAGPCDDQWILSTETSAPILHREPASARLAELVDAAGLGPAAARCGGSSPSPGTTLSTRWSSIGYRERHMNLPIYIRRDIPPVEFVEFWSSHWSSKDQDWDKVYYNSQITDPLCEKNLRDLFIWKNQTPLSKKKGESVRRLVNRIPELKELPGDTSVQCFLERFNNVSAIWRIFLFHCWSKGRYPIYDQHVHRAMSFICNGETEEITKWNDQRKTEAYLHCYLPFFKPFHITPSSQKADQALMVFGRFLKSYRLQT